MTALARARVLSLPLCLAFAWLSACASSAPSPFGGGEGGTLDASDGGRAIPDAFVPVDAANGGDAANDASADADPPDGGADAATPDAEPSDAMSDATTDAAVDVEEDPTEDVTPDAAADTTRDAAIDVPIPPNCGDGVVQAEEGEACDDGNDDPTDFCTNACTEAICGDGIVGVRFGELRASAPIVVSPHDIEGPVCDEGASCPGETCSVAADDTAPEHGICQALGYARALSVTWGGSEGAEADPAPRAFHWSCFDYECFASARSEADGACGAGRMLAEIACEGPVEEPCDDGVNGDAPNQCRPGCELPTCGDGIVDDAFGEDCDDANDVATDGCNLCLFPQCGDGLVQTGEDCDDGNDDETDACRSDCTFPECGDGWVQPGEACDEGSGNSEAPDACRPDCTPARCGDLIIDSNEDCDDGNLIDDDGCSALCRTPQCGDGLVQTAPPFSEECDDGNDDDTDGCSNACRLPACGDGVVQSSLPSIDLLYDFEDGVVPPGLTLSAGDWTVVEDDADGTYSLRSRDIGDSESVEFSLEVSLTEPADLSFSVKVESESCCDDLLFLINGAVTDSWAGSPGWVDAAYELDAGDYVLTWRYDKDGSVSTGADAGWVDDIRLFGEPGADEACDDGEANADAPDACRLDCTLPACGDGIVDSDEACDDGNRIDGDICSSVCELPVCGDGIRQGDEDCDDGNEVETDACRNDCSFAECGDGLVQSGTAVDDVRYNFEGRRIPSAFRYTEGDWILVDDEAATGSQSIRTRDMVDNETVRIELDIELAAATEVRFSFKVSSESCCDDATFYVDGVDAGTRAGEVDWTELAVPVTAGAHTLAWEYDKDGSVSTGDDALWVDNIRFEALTVFAEACDDGEGNSDTAPGACRTTCQLPVCGDGIADADRGEECDDGNETDDDGCSNACALPVCGDGILNGDEECDDANDVDDDGCTSWCQLPGCGDGVINSVETEVAFGGLPITNPFGDTGFVCDDGGTCPAGTCSVAANGSAPEHGICQSLGGTRAVSVAWGGGPGDDSNPMPHAYNWSCTDFVCGPGGDERVNDNCVAGEMLNEIVCLVETVEACDDGPDNRDAPDACRTDCSLPVCGDGIADTGEECDDGNDDDLDACGVDCTLPRCGDGVVQGDEQCDDGNTEGGDACDATCQLPRCGDGVLDPLEACDDGDGIDTNACSNACERNAVVGADIALFQVTGTPVANGSTAGAGDDHQPPEACTTDASADIVVSWSAPSSGRYDINTCGSAYDTYLVVRVGSLDGPVATDPRPTHAPAGLACDDDDDTDLCNLNSRVQIDATEGEVYAIILEGYDGAAGAFDLNIERID